MTARTAPTRRTLIIDRLADEWTRLRVSAAELAAARSWALPGGDIATLDDVLLRCGYRPLPPAGRPSGDPAGNHSGNHSGNRSGDQAANPAGDPAHETYLLGLLAIARNDPLAARIVLQRILPSLCALARRHAPHPAARHAVLDELVGNAWAQIRNYPVERRPRSVVANLVRDVGFQTFVRPARRRNASEVPTAWTELSDREQTTPIEPLDEVVGLLAEARAHGIDEFDLEVICQFLVHGHTTAVAGVRDVSERTARNHRNAAVRRLRAVALAAA